jgi:hypothetical protein
MMLKFFDIHCSVFFNEKFINHHFKTQKKKLMFFKLVGDIVLAEVIANTFAAHKEVEDLTSSLVANNLA